MGAKKLQPASSLIVGMAAAEVGIKHYISEFVPDATWLVEELQTPPLDKMLRHYLPQLPARLKINGEARLPKRILNTLNDGAPLRNKIAHTRKTKTGETNIEVEKLSEILSSVEDLLCFLDYYCGHDWALNYVRPETRKALLEGHR